MAVKVMVKYTCGCGFTTSDEKKAIAHSETTGHTLTALGEVRGEKKNG